MCVCVCVCEVLLCVWWGRLQPMSVLGWRAEDPLCVCLGGGRRVLFTGVECESMGLSKERKRLCA